MAHDGLNVTRCDEISWTYMGRFLWGATDVNTGPTSVTKAQNLLPKDVELSRRFVMRTCHAHVMPPILSGTALPHRRGPVPQQPYGGRKRANNVTWHYAEEVS